METAHVEEGALHELVGLLLSESRLAFPLFNAASADSDEVEDINQVKQRSDETDYDDVVSDIDDKSSVAEPQFLFVIVDDARQQSRENERSESNLESHTHYFVGLSLVLLLRAQNPNHNELNSIEEDQHD